MKKIKKSTWIMIASGALLGVIYSKKKPMIDNGFSSIFNGKSKRQAGEAKQVPAANGVKQI